jgi:hypothetical protein
METLFLLETHPRKAVAVYSVAMNEIMKNDELYNAFVECVEFDAVKKADWLAKNPHRNPLKPNYWIDETAQKAFIRVDIIPSDGVWAKETIGEVEVSDRGNTYIRLEPLFTAEELAQVSAVRKLQRDERKRATRPSVKSDVKPEDAAF